MELQEFYKLFQVAGTVCTDSRNIIADSIFFALKGENFNGNRYALEAIEKGCSFAVVDEDLEVDNDKLILVPNVLEFLQRLANHHRKQFDIPVLAITGTNGKTTTKELINEVLSTELNVVATEGNLNNHIGVPLTLLRINADTQITIIEMGANHLNEISALCRIAEPDFGLITNIGSAHLEGFGSPEGVVRAKNELYKYIKRKKGKLFVNHDDTLLSGLSHDLEKVTYGEDPESDLQGRYVGDIFSGVEWRDNPEIDRWQFAQTKLIGEYNFYNILAAICIGQYFEIGSEYINEALKSYSPGLNRSQYIETDSNRIILDAYNANPDSMRAALKNFYEIDSDEKTLFLGDMFELGDYSHEAHSEIVSVIKLMGFEKVYLAGNEFNSVSGEDGIQFFADIDSLKEHLQKNEVKDSLILLKGSRGMRMEQLLEYL